MEILLIFRTRNIDNKGIQISIPLSKINEIKETSDEDICIVNGYEVIGSFGNIVYDINLLSKSPFTYPGLRNDS